MIPSPMHQAEWVFVLALHFKDMSSIQESRITAGPTKTSTTFASAWHLKSYKSSALASATPLNRVMCRVLSEQLRKHEYKRQALRIR